MTRSAPFISLCAAAVLVTSCKKNPSSKDWHEDPPRPDNLPDVVSEREASDTSHPRLVLDDVVLARVKAHAKADSLLWRKVHHKCEMYAKKALSSGYLGAFWGRAVVDLTLCWKATGEKAWLDKALHYLGGLLDDKNHIGDGKGGDEVIRRNKGYPIRNHGFFVAIAYDWLHDAPGVTPKLREKMVRRLDAWLSWYKEDGYLNYSAYSNYFWGYMSTLVVAGLAVHGEDPVADEWLSEAETLMDEKIVPGFYTYLAGGDWPEGWQYGQLVAAEVAFVVRSYGTATGKDYASNLPWLADLVGSRLHRLRPDKKSVYGNGTQATNPSTPKSLALFAALLATERKNPDLAAEARFLAYELYPEVRSDYAWFAILCDDPAGEPRKDPRRGEDLSYHMKGPGLSFMRSSWDDDAVWVSFQAGPKISIDHQNQDQGHFEIWRGADGLLIDPGAEHSSATINHNSILVDDGREILRYSPSQGVWGKKVKTEWFSDDGEVVVQVGDLRDAWVPKCIKRGCDVHEVDEAIRTFVYVRPDIVVTDDVIELEHDSTWVAWSGHVRAEPTVSGRHVAATWGTSRVDLDVLVPEKAAIEVRVPPTEEVSHPFRANRVAFDTWRIESVTEKGETERRMRVWMSVDEATAKPRSARAVAGEGLSGGIGESGERAVAVLFADTPEGGSALLPKGGADVVVVAGLGRGKKKLTVEDEVAGCRITVAAEDGEDADGEPVMRFSASGCAQP